MAFSTLLGTVCVLYVVAMFGVSLWAQGQVETAEDYLVAGRRLPLSLATATLFATWFGAGTLLTATDEVRAQGLHMAALDPIGAGVCLLLAGAFFARPLWKMGLLTLSDFFRRRFGPRSELIASVLMIPGYTGWIAAQFVALAGVLELFFGLDPALGILMVAAVGTGYTLVGGMWSVTLTDALQMALLLLGIAVLAWTAFDVLGEGDIGYGISRLLAETPPEKLVVVPTATVAKLFAWTGIFCAGALGNLPGQDLMQRVFASKSARVAQLACFIAGVAYLVIGAVPLLVGLSGDLLFPGAAEASILPFLAQRLLSAPLAIVFLLAVMSAVLSTIDSAILSPASVLANNVFNRIPQQRFDALALSRIAVVIVALASLFFAYAGESAYSLLESAYELTLVSLLVPLVLGLYSKRGGDLSALASMAAGTLLWLAHAVVGWETFLEPLTGAFPIPTALACTAVAFGVHMLASAVVPPGEAAASL